MSVALRSLSCGRVWRRRFWATLVGGIGDGDGEELLLLVVVVVVVDVDVDMERWLRRPLLVVIKYRGFVLDNKHVLQM